MPVCFHLCYYCLSWKCYCVMSTQRNLGQTRYFRGLEGKKNRKSEGERNLRTRGLHLPRPPRPEQGEQNQPSSPFPVIVFHFVIINCSLLVSCSCRPIDNKMPPNVACPPLPWIWRLTDVNREANTYSHCFMIHEVICTL